MPPLFCLASGGGYHAFSVTGKAVRSYRTISPLLDKSSGIFSVALSSGLLHPGFPRRRVSLMPGLSS